MQTCTESISHRSAWKGPDFASKDSFAFDLEPRHLAAIDAAMDRVRRAELTLDDIERRHFDLPEMTEEIAALFDEIQHGRGFVLMRGFPLERYSQSEIGIIYWGLGTHFGTGVSQSVLGDRLGHVMDHSKQDPHARAYRSSRELKLHTDFSEIVSLLCLQKAKTGGLTRIASAVTVHNEILAHHPEFLEPLYRGFPFYRSGEQGPGEDPVTPWNVPVYSFIDGALSARYIREYIDRGMAIRGRDPTALEREAIDYFDAVANSPDTYLEFMIEPGEAIFLNNFTVLHARTEFEDDAAAGLKRHLLRLWLDVADGRPAPREMELFESTGIARQDGKTPSGGGEFYKQYLGRGMPGHRPER